MDAIYYCVIFILIFMNSSSKSKTIQHPCHGLVACDRPGGANGARRWHKHVWIANENEYSHVSIDEEKGDVKIPKMKSIWNKYNPHHPNLLCPLKK